MHVSGCCMVSLQLRTFCLLSYSLHDKTGDEKEKHSREGLIRIFGFKER